jgi:hypothetical protein
MDNTKTKIEEPLNKPCSLVEQLSIVMEGYNNCWLRIHTLLQNEINGQDKENRDTSNG